MRLPPRKGEPEGKLVLGLTQAVLSPAESLIFVSICCCRDFFFFALVKNKGEPQGDAGVWTVSHRGVGTAWASASLRHPVSPSYHNKSALFFQP